MRAEAAPTSGHRSPFVAYYYLEEGGIDLLVTDM
jgi:hypothetical protein